MKKSTKIFIISLVGLGASIIAFFIADSFEEKRLETIFKREASERSSLIIKNIEMTELVTESMRSLFVVNDSVSFEDFQTFIYSYKKNITGIQSLEWIPKVSKSERNGFELKARNKYLNNFEIKELNENNELVSAKDRDHYFPVYFVEPMEGNELSLGFNLTSEVRRNNALVESISKNQLVASEPLKLVQSKVNEIGIRLFEPVYSEENNEETQSKLYKNLKGIVGGVFRPRQIVDNALSVLQNKAIDIYIFDETNPQEIHAIYFPKRFTSEAVALNELKNSKQFKTLREFDFADRKWSITAIAQQDFINANTALIPYAVSFSLLMITTFFILFYNRHANEKAKINQIVQQKTKDLKESKERLDLAIHGADLGIWDWDVKQNKVYWNEKCAELLNYSLDEIEPSIEGLSYLIHPGDRREALRDLNKHVRGATPIYRTEYRMLTKNGDWKWILAIGRVVERDLNGKSKRVIGIHVDITERKIGQQKLEKYSQKLENENKNKDKLFSVIAHDLKSPLSAVKGFAEYLLSDHAELNPEEVRTNVGYIYESANNFENILEGLLNWGRAIRDRIAFKPSEYEINSQVKKVLDQQYINSMKKAIKLMDATEGAKFVYAHESMIEIVLRNLISNAIKFTPPHGKVRIDVEEKESDQLLISVSDTGIGIPTEKVNSLFKETYNVSTRGTEGEKGTGLGLAICKEIVNRNGGKIWVKSKEGIGSTFYFTLPLVNKQILTEEFVN